MLEDRNESVSSMEPLLISASSPHRTPLADLALELASASAAFRASLPAGVASALSDLVRTMNCYYSNLIEGHDTHPIAAERAMKGDYSSEPHKRNLQLEARAHITVQRWIDSGGLTGPPTSSASLLDIHRRFCELLPEGLLKVGNPDSGESIPVIPGAWRTQRVSVGRHVPVSAGAVPRFMQRFEQAHSRLGTVDTVLASATAHHRLLWIHPFLDGNGRVSRLMSHAMLLRTLDTGSLWSVSRGLARKHSVYKQHLAACDSPRRNDLDGRGNLSEEAMADFARFFLETAIDQVRFMRSLVAPERLRESILDWTRRQSRAGKLPDRSGVVLEAVLYRGHLPRGDVPGLLGVTDRQSRRLTAALTEAGVLTSASSRGDLHLAFPARLAGQWMPGLFPDQEEEQA